MSAQRKVRLFRNGRNQAVRIPREFELPGKEALMHREGDRVVIEAAAPEGPNARLLAVLAALPALGPDDEFPQIEDHRAGAVDL